MDTFKKNLFIFITIPSENKLSVLDNYLQNTNPFIITISWKNLKADI